MRLMLALPLALVMTSVSHSAETATAVSSSQDQDAREIDAFRDFMSGIERYNGWGDKPQDYWQAHEFFKSAAREGHKQSQHYLGLMYYKGLGVEKDNIEAYKWFDLASSNGDKVGLVLKLTLKDILSPDQLKEAESRRDEWLHTLITK